MGGVGGTSFAITIGTPTLTVNVAEVAEEAVRCPGLLNWSSVEFVPPVKVIVKGPPGLPVTATLPARVAMLVRALVNWAAVVVAYVAVVGSLILLARSGSPSRRAALYGLAGGITWALEATFIKSATDDLARAGLSGLFTNWSVYAVAVGGAAGVVIEQAALQSGPLRVSQPLLTITDPIVSIALSVWLFGEYFVLNPPLLPAAAAGFVVMCGGVVLLSLTAPAPVEGDVCKAGDAATVRDEL